MKKIFITCYGGGHVNLINNILPLFENFEVYVLALTKAIEVIDYSKCKVISIEDIFNLYNESEKVEILSLGKEIITNDLTLSTEDSQFYMGIGMFNLIKEYGVELANVKFSKFGRHCFLQKDSALKILDFFKPDIVISTTSPRFELAMIIEAKKRGLVNIQIDDLTADPSVQFIADEIIVLDSIVKERLNLRLNYKPKIHVLGNIVFSNFIKSVLNINSQKLKEKHTIEGIVVTFAPSKNIKLNDCYERIDLIDDFSFTKEFEIFSDIKKSGYDFTLIVRPHRNEDINIYNNFKNLINFRVIDNKLMNIEEAISVSDIWVTSISTTGFQASLVNKVVVTYTHDLDGKNVVKEYESLPFIYANSLEHLGKKLKHALDIINNKTSTHREELFKNKILNSEIKFKNYFNSL